MRLGERPGQGGGERTRVVESRAGSQRQDSGGGLPGCQAEDVAIIEPEATESNHRGTERTENSQRTRLLGSSGTFSRDNLAEGPSGTILGDGHVRLHVRTRAGIRARPLLQGPVQRAGARIVCQGGGKKVI